MSKTVEITPAVPPRGITDPPRIDERYRIEKEIGRGGMGRVFVAHDRKLGRDVAIKVLASGLHDEEALRRFEQEARATCALNHANILDVHDIGTHDGCPYIVSELLHGTTLRERLRSGPLTVQQASGYGLQLGQGLSAAHEKGIVHRDLKPENLFITEEGRLKILDFGIAKLVTPEAGETLPSRRPHTEEGAVLGTVGYMSPEQVRGQPADERSDIFSFGAIFYEMFAGRGAFERDTAVETAYAILNDAPPPLPASVPLEFQRIVRRCLEKDPEDRFPTAREIALSLARLSLVAGADRAAAQRRRAVLILGSGLLIALGFAALLGRGVLRRTWERPLTPSIAVLPFVDMSPTKDQEYFSEGVSEEILNELAQVDGLKVSGRTSSFSFKGRSEDLREIGQKLGVGAVLEGSVRKAGNRVRITAQVVKVADGFHVWSQTYDRDLTDIFAMQGEIAKAVVAALKVKLRAGGAPRKIHPARDPEAYRLFLLGRSLALLATEENNSRSLAILKRAVTLEPSYAPAWAFLALLHGSITRFALRTEVEKRTREALEEAERAIALEPDYEGGYAARGYVRGWLLWDWTGAQSDLERALALNSKSADVLDTYAGLMQKLGRLKEAIEVKGKVAEINPLDADAWGDLCAFLYADGQLRAAREACSHALDISPTHDAALTVVYIDLSEGHAAEALAAVEHLPVERSRLLVGAAIAQYELRHVRESDEALQQLVARVEGPEGNIAYRVAQVQAWRGERDRAFEWLDRAYARHDLALRIVKIDPLLRKLHGDPRFTALLRKMNLPVD